MSKDYKFVRLKSQAGWLKQFKQFLRNRANVESFLEWVRGQEKPLTIRDLIGEGAVQESLDEVFRAMMRGDSVPKMMMSEFAFFLTEHLHLGRKYTFAQISEPCDPPAATTEGIKPPIPPLNTHSELIDYYCQAYETFTNKFAIYGEAFCEEHEVAEVAKHIFLAHGWRNGPLVNKKRLTGEAAIKYCVANMKRELEDYVEFLKRIWKKEKRTVMYAIHVEASGKRNRIGISVVFPVTIEFYYRLRRGEVVDMDITPDDIDPFSNHIYISVLSDVIEGVKRSADRATRDALQKHTLNYQVASLCPLVTDPPRPYRIITFADKEGAERAKRHGYVDVGVVAPGIKLPLLELRKPDKDADKLLLLKMLPEFMNAHVILDMFQFMIENKLIVVKDRL